VTSHYLSDAYGSKQGCVQAQKPGAAASSVAIQRINAPDPTIAPNRTTAKVVAHGGIYDGEKLTVSLVQEGGSWKVDAIRSNAPVGP
jgi:hypothetical protein